MEEDLSELIKSSAKGSVILSVGHITSSIITALGIILVARFLGSTTYGQVSVTLIPISIGILFIDLGVSSGLIKHIAQYRVERRFQDINTIVRVGSLINCMAGLTLTTIIFLASNFLASKIFHQPEIGFLIKLASFNLLAHSLIKTSQAAFVGFERLEFFSVIIVIQSIFKSLLGPLLILIGLGALGAILGNTIPLITSGILGTAVLFFILLRQHSSMESSLQVSEGAKLLFFYGYPLLLSNLFTGALNQIYNFLMAIHVDAYHIGNYQAALNFTVLVTFFTMPITTMLFPLFSKLEKHETKTLGLVFQNTVKYSSLVVVPLAMLLICLSDPLVRVVYGGSYPLTPHYTGLYFLSFLFVGLGSLSMNSLLNGQGETKITFRKVLVSLSVGLPLSLVLIPRYGIVGLIISIILAPQAGLLYGLWWVKRNLGFSVNFKSSTKIYLASSLSYAATYFFKSYFNTSDIFLLVCGTGIFSAVYLALILIIGSLDGSDVQNLRIIVDAMGPFAPIFNLLLNILEKFAK